MKRSRDEFQPDPNILLEEALFPPLNLPLTITEEFTNLIESVLEKDYSSSHQQKIHGFTENTKTITPPEIPKIPEKTKAVNFPISKITIGQWTRMAVYPDDLKAKFYFAKKKLIWEFLDKIETETQVARLKRKIEIQWADVLSFRRTFNSHDETGTLEVELGKRPTFFMETNPQAGKHTQWKQMDQDFTLDQSASVFRRHTLHFAPGVLQKNLEKLLSTDSFWSKLATVSFPVLQDPCFDIGYGNDNNNNNNSNTSSFLGHCETLSFNISNDLLNHNSQGIGHVPVGEVNFNMENQLCVNDGRHMNSFVQDNLQNNSANQLPWTQVIQPSSQLVNQHYNMGGYFTEPQFNNPMIQDEYQITNTMDLRGSQAYATELLETQTNSTRFQNMNELSIYPEVGPYLRGLLAQEGETQYMQHTQLDGNFQTNIINNYDQYFRNNGLLPPAL